MKLSILKIVLIYIFILNQQVFLTSLFPNILEGLKQKKDYLTNKIKSVKDTLMDATGINKDKMKEKIPENSQVFNNNNNDKNLKLDNELAIDGKEIKQGLSYKVLFMYKKQQYQHDKHNALSAFNYKNLVFSDYEAVFFNSPFPNLSVYYYYNSNSGC